MATGRSSAGDALFGPDFLARLERLRLIAKRLAGRRTPGGRRSRRLGDGLEFADHRDYTPGDDVRYLDWHYYGRMERLLLRLCHEHSEAVVTILLDSSASMAVGSETPKFDYARRAAAALTYVAMGALERVRLSAFADQPGPSLLSSRDRGRLPMVLEWLAALRPGGRTALGGGAGEVSARADGGLVLVLSDLLDCPDQLDAALAHLKLSRHDTAVVHVISPADAEPALTGAVLLEDAESSQRRGITVTDYVIENYRRAWQEFCAGCASTCRRRGADYLPARTDQPLEQLVLHTMRLAGLVG